MQVRDWFRLVRFSHTVFALPFASVGYGLGVRTIGDFVPLTLILVLLCMVTNRNAAMAFNRLVDARYDALNPRTAGRASPATRAGASSSCATRHPVRWSVQGSPPFRTSSRGRTLWRFWSPRLIAWSPCGPRPDRAVSVVGSSVI